MNKIDEHTLEYLLAYDGRIHHMQEGYWLKFVIKKVTPTDERPAGIDYSFTLHGPNGKRLIGFDNAHSVRPGGSGFKAKASAYDHWHRTDKDKGSPYKFVSADKLLENFFKEVQRVLSGLGLSDEVISVEDTKERKPK